jgi:hypothetical protein
MVQRIFVFQFAFVSLYQQLPRCALCCLKFIFCAKKLYYYTEWELPYKTLRQ